MFLILLSICIDFINTPLHQDSGIQIYTKKISGNMRAKWSMLFGPEGSIILWPKGSILFGQRGQICLAFPSTGNKRAETSTNYQSYQKCFRWKLILDKRGHTPILCPLSPSKRKMKIGRALPTPILTIIFTILPTSLIDCLRMDII